MKPVFTLAAGYKPRRMCLVLAPNTIRPRLWSFYGRCPNTALLVPARFPDLPRAAGSIWARRPDLTFRSRSVAEDFANVYDLPAYSIWNGRRKTYEGLCFEAMAYPRDHESSK